MEDLQYSPNPKTFVQMQTGVLCWAFPVRLTGLSSSLPLTSGELQWVLRALPLGLYEVL